MVDKVCAGGDYFSALRASEATTSLPFFFLFFSVWILEKLHYREKNPEANKYQLTLQRIVRFASREGGCGRNNTITLCASNGMYVDWDWGGDVQRAGSIRK